MTTSLCLCRQGLEGNGSLSKVFPASSCSLASRSLSLTAFAVLPVAVITRTVTTSVTRHPWPCFVLLLSIQVCESPWPCQPCKRDLLVYFCVTEQAQLKGEGVDEVASQWSGRRSGILMQMRSAVMSLLTPTQPDLC